MHMALKLVHYDEKSSRVLPYSRKIWQGIKFCGLAVAFATVKLKYNILGMMKVMGLW